MGPILLIMWTAFQSSYCEIIIIVIMIITMIINFKECIKRIGVNVRLEVIQKKALLGRARILRKVLSL